MQPRLSRRLAHLPPSAIRELLKLTERPEVLSFAGGLPAPEAFPTAAIARAHAEVLEKDGPAALQYGATEGFGPLRLWVAERMRAHGLGCSADNVLITAGSQQGIDLVGRALLDPGDEVIVESPSYLAALQVFQGCEARFTVVASDDHGMRVDEVERRILEGGERPPRLIYIVPNFQNPRGTTLPLERRRELARLSLRHAIPILEDDPYGELRYSGEPLPPIAALEPEAPVLYLSSFSKTLAPGLRLGWAVAREELLRPLIIAKQAADLHTNTLSQRAVAHLLQDSDFDFEAHLVAQRKLYGTRCAAMLSALAANLPAGSSWTRPEGGLFVWATLPDGYDAELLMRETMRENVAFVPGAPFFAAQPDRRTMRLNFSNCSPERIAEGMSRLGRVLRNGHGRAPPRAALREVTSPAQ